MVRYLRNIHIILAALKYSSKQNFAKLKEELDNIFYLEMLKRK
jgi:hypothetical protein